MRRVNISLCPVPCHCEPLQEAPEWNPFPTLEVAWTPRGHEPQSVYAVPHFDL